MNAKRAHMRDLMQLLIANEPKVHYRQARPMATRNLSEDDLRRALRSPRGVSMDCSEAVTLICRLAGLKDPNGFNYNGYGNTETLYAHLPHYYWAGLAQVGALVDVNNPDHVCMVLRRGLDPLLFSMGSERGPIAIRASAERRFHPGGMTFLKIQGLLRGP